MKNKKPPVSMAMAYVLTASFIILLIVTILFLLTLESALAKIVLFPVLLVFESYLLSQFGFRLIAAAVPPPRKLKEQGPLDFDAMNEKKKPNKRVDL